MTTVANRLNIDFGRYRIENNYRKAANERIREEVKRLQKKHGLELNFGAPCWLIAVLVDEALEERKINGAGGEVQRELREEIRQRDYAIASYGKDLAETKKQLDDAERKVCLNEAIIDFNKDAHEKLVRLFVERGSKIDDLENEMQRKNALIAAQVDTIEHLKKQVADLHKAQGVRSRPADVPDIDGEGDVVSLVKERASSYPAALSAINNECLPGFYINWCPDGEKPPSYRYHGNEAGLEGALKEARRLSSLHPGMEFYTLAAMTVTSLPFPALPKTTNLYTYAEMSAPHEIVRASVPAGDDVPL